MSHRSRDVSQIWKSSALSCDQICKQWPQKLCALTSICQILVPEYSFPRHSSVSTFSASFPSCWISLILTKLKDSFCILQKMWPVQWSGLAGLLLCNGDSWNATGKCHARFRYLTWNRRDRLSRWHQYQLPWEGNIQAPNNAPWSPASVPSDSDAPSGKTPTPHFP